MTRASRPMSNDALIAARQPVRKARVGVLALATKFPRVTVAAGLVALLFLVALLAPIVSPHDPLAINPDNTYLPPLSPGHLLGTDELGRDLFSRVLWGTRVSVPVAFVAVAVGLFAGGIVGLICGYAGGVTDLLLMRFIDALLAFPGLILAIALVGALGPGLRNAMIAIGIVAIPTYARLVRGQVLQLKQMDYVTATRSLGARPIRLVLGHILPNLLNPIIVQVSLSAGFAILAEATLSFLGLGAQVPTPDWGQMINSGRTFLTNDPWLAIVPGAAISVAVFSLNWLGYSLRDALDPRLRSLLLLTCPPRNPGRRSGWRPQTRERSRDPGRRRTGDPATTGPFPPRRAPGAAAHRKQHRPLVTQCERDRDAHHAAQTSSGNATCGTSAHRSPP